MVSATVRPAAIAIGGLVALGAAVGIGRFVFTPILPFMEAGIGLTKAEAGLIAPANFLGYLLGALGASWQALPVWSSIGDHINRVTKIPRFHPIGPAFGCYQ